MQNLRKTKNSLNLDQRCNRTKDTVLSCFVHSIHFSSCSSEPNVQTAVFIIEFITSANRLSSGWHLRVSLFAGYPMIGSYALWQSYAHRIPKRWGEVMQGYVEPCSRHWVRIEMNEWTNRNWETIPDNTHRLINYGF